ncbi:acetyltransferase [Rheinheimera texasensis]|uniref:acetyltransferase n=1 Tax=Rheinheimera texasensis TaxID=306205 RepID=UPI000689FCFA|nr:acetyltransferase [Rheinheimera texasensis]
MKNVVLLGAGGHAKVVLDALQLSGYRVNGVISPDLVAMKATHWRGLPVLGADDALNLLSQETDLLANGLGMLPAQTRRRQLFLDVKMAGFQFVQVLHPAAVISDSAKLGEGVQVFAGAVIQADAEVADNVIINTRAVVEHDTYVGAHSHLAPGAVVCGQVAIGCDVFVGAGATVIQGIRVGDGAVIGAGTAVVRDLRAHIWCRGSTGVCVDKSDTGQIGEQ